MAAGVFTSKGLAGSSLAPPLLGVAGRLGAAHPTVTGGVTLYVSLDRSWHESNTLPQDSTQIICPYASYSPYSPSSSYAPDQ